MKTDILTARLTCPNCSHVETETIPNDRCLFFYECKACRAILKPKPGDCCVFCSFADRPCLSAPRVGSSK
ncbi:MAG TPA: GDCCVxC domain-containing (seleno)protein [Candidatus Acidoferrales bacterium]|nr:GDCCVxC domain-containing (seleno)protein [Candidatus Acidoferrales bacterium]